MYVAIRGGLRNIARDRKYKSGTGWCVWRWTDVDSEYILRLHVFKTPWCAVCLHWIRKPDAEPWLHDHPVSFLSLILRGSYAELRARGDGDVGHVVHRWCNVIRARPTDRHRIIFCRANTLTLCFMGPKKREWGFHMPAGWIGWKDYYARLKAGENMRMTSAFTADDPFLPAFEKVLDEHYTKERIALLTGANVVGEETERVIDTAPAEDFVAEEPTVPPWRSPVGPRTWEPDRPEPPYDDDAARRTR